MPLSAEERTDLTRLFMFVWVNAWARYRGLLALLDARGLGPAQRLEANLEARMQAHQSDLSREAVVKYDEFVARLDRRPPS